MKILITGAKGFVGKNLVYKLKKIKYLILFEYDLDANVALLDNYVKECNFVFHLAGINRPQDESEFDSGNRQFTSRLTHLLQQHENTCPIVFSSSIQAERDNPYGKSKKAAEDELFSHADITGAKVMIYRLPNIFGRWCRPNYNSVVATFCYNIAHNRQIKINDSETELNLCYIDDVLEEFINTLEGKETRNYEYCQVAKTHKVKLGDLANLIYDFRNACNENRIPSFKSEFEQAIYDTYISYLMVGRG